MPLAAFRGWDYDAAKRANDSSTTLVCLLHSDDGRDPCLMLP